MAGGRVEFEIVTTGENAAQRAFENLKIAEMEAAARAADLRKELEQLTQSGQASQAVINEVAREYVRATQAQQSFADAARKARQAQQQVGNAAAMTGRDLGGLVNTIAELGYSLGTAIPGMQQFGTQLAMMGGSAYQLGASFGPVGAAIGTVIGLLPTIISGFQRLRDEADANAEAMQRMANATKETAEAIDELVRANERRDAKERIRSGGGTFDELNQQLRREQAQLRQLEGQRAEIQAAIDRHQQARAQALQRSLRAFQQEEREQERRLQRLAEIERDIATQAERVAQAEQRASEALIDPYGTGLLQIEAREAFEAFDEPTRRRRRGPRGPTRGPRGPTLEQLMSRAAGGSFEHNIAAIYDEATRAVERLDEAERKRAERQQREREKREREMEKQRREAARLRREQERQLREAERAHEQFVDQTQSALQPVVTSITKAFAEIAAGTKSVEEAFQGLLASFLEYAAEQAAISAAREYAEAIAAFASYRYDQGAQHLAAGVAFTAVAVAAGGASIAVSPPSGINQPASPQANAAVAAGPQNVTINWNSPVITAGTRAELGREIGNLIAVGDRRFGGVRAAA